MRVRGTLLLGNLVGFVGFVVGVGVVGCGDNPTTGESGTSTASDTRTTSATSGASMTLTASASASGTSTGTSSAGETSRGSTTRATDPTSTGATSESSSESSSGSTSDGTTGDPPPPAGTLRFDAILSYSITNNDNRVLAADINDDGLTDMIGPQSTFATVGVTFADGMGGYGVKDMYPVTSPLALALGDLDGDGKDDIVATSTNSGMRLLKGAGGGVFEPAIHYPDVDLQRHVILSDIDGDGDLDLLAATSSNYVGVHLNDGVGNLTELPTIPYGSTVKRIKSADLNDDGVADLITAYNTFTPHIRVGLANGDGSFTQLPSIVLEELGGIPVEDTWEIALDDVNDDGRIDLAVVDRRGVSILLGGPGGSFEQFSRYEAGDFGSGVALGDFDGDDILDLATVSFDDQILYVRAGVGDGSFADPPLLYNSAVRSASLHAVELDGKSPVDLAAVSSGASVALGRGDGTFHAAPVLIGGQKSTEAAVADVTGDGVLDVIVGYQLSGEVAVFPGVGDGSFGDPLEPLLSAGGEVLFLRVGDLNGDGNPDLLTGVKDKIAKDLHVRMGDGDGGFGPATVYPKLLRFELGDLNGDGVLDVLAGGAGALHPLLGEGDGTLVPAAKALAADENIDRFTLADFDDDGNLDAAVVNFTLNELELFTGLGDGTFAEETLQIPSGEGQTFRVDAGDFTGDGIIDLLRGVSTPVPIPGAPGLAILPGLGDGSFGAPLGLDDVYFPAWTDYIVADFTNDDRLDIVYPRGNVGVNARIGFDGGFAEPTKYSILLPSAFAVGDLDSDGRTDLIITTAAQHSRSHAAVFMNISE